MAFLLRVVRRFVLHGASILIAALLIAWLLGACGSTSSPTANLPSSTKSTSATSVQGDYVALLPDGHARVALSTDGKQIIAYACDGDNSHSPTFAPWFEGSLSENTVDLSSTTGERLQATLTLQDATGTLTLQDGSTLSFRADPLTKSESEAESGLYRSEATLNNAPYLAGWIVDKPSTATGSLFSPTAMIVPPPRRIVAIEDNLAYLNPLEYHHEGGGRAIVNRQTGELLAAPQLTDIDISSKQVLIPTLGTFPLTKCQHGTCA